MSQEKTAINQTGIAILKKSITPRIRNLAKDTRTKMITAVIDKIDEMESIALETIEQENHPQALQDLLKQFELECKTEWDSLGRL